MRLTHFTLTAFLIAALTAYAPLADADPGKGRGHGKEKHKSYSDDGGGHGKGRGKNKQDKGDSYHFSFNSDDRFTIKRLLANRYAPNCPPGLAKKHNGCLPPGIAKKRYRIGYPLAQGVGFEYLPDSWLAQLGAIPASYSYVMVDKDVLLISEATHKVVDAITLLSAVGK